MKDLLHLMALTKVKLVGSVHAKTLLTHFGNAADVFKASQSELKVIPNIGEKIASNIRRFNAFSDAEKELKFIEKNKIKVHTYFDESYPHRLKHYNDAPIILYQKGEIDLNFPRAVAIVGTRKATERGKDFCKKLVKELKEYDIIVNSGLAYGIDYTAHKQSVESNIPTIGVLAHGLDRIYPATHQGLATKMLANGGLVTEFPSETNPDRQNFPSRNRIIAGMSDAVIVVETKITGGSMITAHIANNYNKDVFAVPGRLQDEHSKGCNHLIKTHKAALIESAEDIGYIMRWDKKDESAAQIQRQIFVDLTPEESQIVNLLRTKENIGTDKLSFDLQKSTSQIAVLMLGLEFKGVVKPLPGSRFALVR
ncbi:MAG: DNA-processing protein DprA [Saprospiraceae bacterium]